MRIGILAEGGSTVFQWDEIRGAIHAMDAQVFYLTECPTKSKRKNYWNIPARLVWKIIRTVESRKFDFTTEYFIPEKSIRVECYFRGHFKEFPESEISKISKLELDLIIRLGGHGIYRGQILDVAKYGIISVHHGDNHYYRGGPPGFWEILNGEDSCGFIVQKLTKVLDGGQILKRGSVAINPYVTLNMKSLFKAADLATAEVVKYIDEQKQFPAMEKSTKKLGPIYRMPNIVSLFKYLKIIFQNSKIGASRKHRIK